MKERTPIFLGDEPWSSIMVCPECGYDLYVDEYGDCCEDGCTFNLDEHEAELEAAHDAYVDHKISEMRGE